MLLTIMAQNLGHGGLQDGDGNPEDRWPDLAKRINEATPAVDILLLCEANNWGKYGHKQLVRARRDLGLEALPLSPSNSGYGTAVLYRSETVGPWVRWNTDFSHETLHGFGVASFDIGLPKPLSVVPAHLDPHDASKAAQEANLIATRGYRYGPYAVIGGDINYPPLRGPEPLYGKMKPYNLAARTELPSSDDEPLRPIRTVTRLLAKNGYVDAALRLYDQTGDETLLERTAKDDRLDQFWVSSPLASALVSYQRLTEPAGASDHDGVVVQIDTERIDTAHNWGYD